MPEYSSLKELFEDIEENPGENRRCRYDYLENFSEWDEIDSESFLKALTYLETYARFFDEDKYEKVQRLGEKLLSRDLEVSVRSKTHQTLANNCIDSLSDEDVENSWPNERRMREFQHLRKSLSKEGLDRLEKEEKCQKLVNMGNSYSRQGRFIEAMRYFRMALKELPDFPEAKLNMSIAKQRYGRVIDSERTQFIFFYSSYNDLKEIDFSNIKSMPPKEIDRYKMLREKLDSVDTGGILQELEDLEIAETDEEQDYRDWALDERLFLNALNDIDKHPAGAIDQFHISQIQFDINGENPFPGLYNQMKQEYVSARYMYYRGVNAEGAHFSDREVLMVDTLDYPVYSYGTELTKSSLRMSYSIFDKIAYFLNEYMDLGINGNAVSFNNIWFKDQTPKKGLREEFSERKDNIGLQALYWLRTDFYWDKMNVEESVDLVAQDLAEVRHQLEHKYLKVHEWDVKDRAGAPPYENTLKFSISKEKLEEYGLEMLKTSRAALIYLILAVNIEEKNKAETSDSGTGIGFIADKLEDEWKK